jgi:glycerol-3-phosphate acyltransferase PlsY
MLQSFTLSLLPAYAAALLFGYLCGSVPFGLIITRLAGTRDIRSIGSGNIGATNVLRTGRKGLAAATLVGDALKGTFAVLAIYYYYGLEYRYFAHDLAIPAAFGAFLGHLFPVWLGFKGGKGVATYIGLLLALAWPVAIAFCVARRARRQRYDAVGAVAARLLAGAGAVRPADGAVVGHAPRQHRPADERHRGQDREERGIRYVSRARRISSAPALRRKQSDPMTRTEPPLPYAATMRRRSTASRKRKWPR